MERSSRRMRPSPAMIVAVLALFVALGGTAAALKRNSIKSRHIAPKAVQNSEMKFVKSFELKRVEPTPGPTDEAAQAAAPSVKLYKRDPFTISAKCFRGDDSGLVKARVFISSDVDGAIFESANADQKPGGADSADFLGPLTPEGQRELVTGVGAGADAADGSSNVRVDNQDDLRAVSEFFAAAPGRRMIGGHAWAVAKQGTLAAGDFVYGPGNACLFGGYALG